MNTTILAIRLQACSASIAEGRPEEAQRLLADLEAAATSPAAAALHRQLSARAQRALDAGRRRAASDGAPPTAADLPSLVQHDQGEPLPGVTLVSACMNRQDNLLKVLPSWLASGADEIIVVDWSSREPVAPMLAHIDDPRLRVVRIDDEPRWILTHAFNVGLRLARHAVVYKLDADIQLAPGFIGLNPVDPGEFVRGFWRRAVEAGQDDQRYINGSFGARKTDLRAVGYYDERIRTYGWDDSDLYHRLSHAQGLAGRLIAHGSLRHLHQTDDSRLANQDIGPHSFMGWFGPTDHENAINKFQTAISLDWDGYHPAQDFALRSEGGRLQTGRRTTAVPPPPADERDLASVLGARQLVAWHGAPLPPSARSLGESLEFSRLLKQAHDAACGQQLAAALVGGQGLHLVVAETDVLRQMMEHTVGIVCAHHPRAAEVVVIVGDDGYRPGAAPPRCPRVLRASVRLVETLAASLGATQRRDLDRLEAELGSGQGTGCTHWTVTAQTVAASAVAHATAISDQLAGSFSPASAPAPRTAFVTSVYDEGNLLRLLEYLACLALNFRAVEHLVLMYEARNGLFQLAAQALCKELSTAPGRLALLPFDRRPTFEELFSVQPLLPEGTLLVVGNADVALDATLADLAREARQDHVYVLSRRDIADDGRSAKLIRLECGIPNIFSADAWIARTPFRPDFRLNYEIGSFHCDSFINNQLSLSRQYQWANPCLDVHVFHLHDSRFNSSAEKHVRDRAEIERRYGLELERSGNKDPIKGAPWSHLSQATLAGSSSFLINWRPKALVLDAVPQGFDLACLLWLEALRPCVEADGYVALVLRLRTEDSRGPAGALISQYKQHFGCTSLILEIDDHAFDAATAPKPAVMVRHADTQRVLDNLSQGDAGCLAADVAALIAWPTDAPDLGQMRIEWNAAMSPAQTTRLASAMQRHLPEQLDRLIAFFKGLNPWSDPFRLVQPILDDLPSRPEAPALVGLHAPAVSLVTSLFRGSEFLHGYLENAAEAAIAAGGEVILVDANCDGHDTEAIERFFADRPELRRCFDIVRLDTDPGLYACWRIAIERARGEFISNANLDDRRSPQHTRRLVQALQARPHLAGGAGSISAVFRHAPGHWFELHPNQVWFHDLGEREFGFDDLFARNDDGTVRSHNIMHCMPVWRRSLHERHGFFDEERYGTSADWAFWLRCASAGERFWLEPSAFGRYFVNPDSHNRRNDTNGAKERRIIADLLGVQQTTLIKQ